MRTSLYAIVLSLSAVLASEPAFACIRDSRLDLEHVKYASAVVVGRISDYEVVGPLGRRYARFTVFVEEVLVGEPVKTLLVTWNNSTFGEPDKMGDGPFLIGLLDPGSSNTPLPDLSVILVPAPERDTVTVLQRNCEPAFLFESTSVEANAVRKILSEKQQ